MISKNACRDEELVETWSSRLQRWGLGGLVPFAAGILRPFGFLGAQALHMFAPVLTSFSSPADIDDLAALLESPEALDRLADQFSPPNQD